MSARLFLVGVRSQGFLVLGPLTEDEVEKATPLAKHLGITVAWAIPFCVVLEGGELRTPGGQAMQIPDLDLLGPRLDLASGSMLKAIFQRRR